jgi:outer membrane protein OmpA-like peptidoglycan-associated protein
MYLLVGSLLAVLLAGCGGVLGAQIKPVRAQLEQARAHGAPACAPQAFAAAEAYLDFADGADQCGDRLDAEVYLSRAKAKLAEARHDCEGGGQGQTPVAPPTTPASPSSAAEPTAAATSEPEEAGDEEEEAGTTDEPAGAAEPNETGASPEVEGPTPGEPEPFNGFVDVERRPEPIPPSRRKFIPLPEVQFVADSLTFTYQSIDNLRVFAQRLMAHPELRVRIEGYTYARGDAAAEQQLSKKKAEKVRDALISFGVEAARITAFGFGAEHPIADNETYAGRRKNDRIEFIIYLQ